MRASNRAWTAALNDPEIRGIVIATPAETHYRLARAAIEAGKDVLVEKPLTLDIDEGERLVALANERRAILMSATCSNTIRRFCDCAS